MLQNPLTLGHQPMTGFNPAPTIWEQTPQGGLRAWSIDSKMLEDERNIFLTGPFNDYMSDAVVKQLMYLKSKITGEPTADNNTVTLYVNSPGGVVTSGLAIYDTFQNMGCQVSTVVMGIAASMGSFIAMAGTKGKRLAMPNAEIMIHQPSGGYQGQATDFEIHCRHIQRTKERMTALYAKHCGGTPDEWKARMERDNFLTAQEALDIGLVDGIVGQ